MVDTSIIQRLKITKAELLLISVVTLIQSGQLIKFVIGGDYTPTIANNFKLIAGLYTGVSVINLKSHVKK